MQEQDTPNADYLINGTQVNVYHKEDYALYFAKCPDGTIVELTIPYNLPIPERTERVKHFNEIVEDYSHV